MLVIFRLTCPPGTFPVGYLKERVYVKKPPLPFNNSINLSGVEDAMTENVELIDQPSEVGT